MPIKTYKPLLIDSIKAAADLKKQRFIGFDGDYCKEGSKAFGIVDVETEKDQYVPAAISGILLIECGGSISAFDEITSDSQGRAIKLDNNGVSNGFALDEGIEGDVIRIVRGI